MNKKRDNKVSVAGYFMLAIIMLFFLLPAGAAFSQEKERVELDDLAKQKILEDETEIVYSASNPTRDKYVYPDVQNLSKLYWAIGKLDIEDTSMIDYYLLINECPLYIQYYNNDFEWSKIRQATRQHILKNMDSFPTEFELITPIGLGRYDLENEEFDILENDRFIGLRRLDFAVNSEEVKETCAHTGEIYDYPRNMIIILDRGFTLEKVPVKKELAKLYIKEAKKNFESLPPNLQIRNYERIAFLRLKVKITQYKNTIRVVNGDLRAVVFGRVDGVELYADYDKLKPLYAKDTQRKRFRRLRNLGMGGDSPWGGDENIKKKEEDLSDKTSQ